MTEEIQRRRVRSTCLFFSPRGPRAIGLPLRHYVALNDSPSQFRGTSEAGSHAIGKEKSKKKKEREGLFAITPSKVVKGPSQWLFLVDDLTVRPPAGLIGVSPGKHVCQSAGWSPAAVGPSSSHSPLSRCSVPQLLVLKFVQKNGEDRDGAGHKYPSPPGTGPGGRDHRV
ncbi:hypothetical protein SKAU_G00012910 [Synaphobranchus kaupii]|uniref:Uncharacterized protein n=1 Tax=Synaphobranchus kaupii TaxID=118154 RepID=A0A9Q1GBC2_SYNKA|nr:hypothetical protein SKAU_G00012910 [Synaphobranchus kaupii]